MCSIAASLREAVEHARLAARARHARHARQPANTNHYLTCTAVILIQQLFKLDKIHFKRSFVNEQLN